MIQMIVKDSSYHYETLTEALSVLRKVLPDLCLFGVDGNALVYSSEEERDSDADGSRAVARIEGGPNLGYGPCDADISEPGVDSLDFSRHPVKLESVS